MYKAVRTLMVGFMLLLLVQPLAAQALTETFTSSGGLIVQHPAGWEVTDDRLAVSILDEGETLGVAVAVAGGIEDFFGIDASAMTRDALLDALLALLESSGENIVAGERGTTTLANGEASFLQLTAPNDIDVLLVTLRLADDTPLVGLVAKQTGILSGAEREVALNIIGSASYDPSLAVEDDFSFDDDLSMDDIVVPEDAVMIADLEPGTLRFSSGALVRYPDGWKLYDESKGYITDSATLIFGENIFNYKALLVITVQDGAFFTLDDYASFILPMMFGMYSGVEREFDPETDLRTITLEDGRELRTLALPEESENPFFGTIFLSPVDAQYYVSFLLTILNASDEERASFLADIEAMASGAEMTLREGAVLFEGRQLDIVEADCFTTDAYNISENNPYAIYNCPAGCTEGGTVWGTDIYTNDSAVCVAAVHADVISSAAGGLVLLTWQPGQDSYASTTRNGVTTSEYGAWGGSFTVAPAPVGDE